MEALPEWSRRTLTAHAADPRPSALPLATLEAAATGDRVWDSMQACLVRHGELHNNLRMTWGKAFLSWAPSPGSALAWALELNHKYALDGGDPCSYGGVLWCFGGFDGPKVRLRVYETCP